MPEHGDAAPTEQDLSAHEAAAHDLDRPLIGKLVPRTDRRLARRTRRPDLTAVRERVVDLSRNPAAVATATVVAGLAVNVVREVAKSGVVRRSPAVVPVEVSGQVVHYVHVIHHIVHSGYVPRTPPSTRQPLR